MRKVVIVGIVVSILVFAGVRAYAGWNPLAKEEEAAEIAKKEKAADAAKKEAIEKVKVTISEFKKRDSGMKVFFDEAYGYAVFPTVGKGAIAIGGAYGQGKVFELGKLIGSATLKQVSIGIQLGGQSYSEIVFFKDKAALDTFTSNNLEFGASASAILVTSGASADTDYSNGVAIFTLPKGGLMAEASVAGQKFRFAPEK